MKRLRFLLILIAVSVAGYALGRATVTSELGTLVNGHREIPLFPAPPKSEPAVPVTPQFDSDVIVEEPTEGSRSAGTAFQVSGRAKVAGEAGSKPATAVIVTVADAAGAELFSQSAPLTATAGQPYGRFSLTVTLPSEPDAAVTVAVRRDVEGATPVSRLLAFGTRDGVPVRAYLQKSSGPDCAAVEAVERIVDAQTAVYRAAVEALIAGPNADEVADGYATAIPTGTILKSIAANAEGIVTADFNDKLTARVTDPCRLASQRAQIEATLKQFPEVRGVVISVNGEELEPPPES